MKAGAGIGVSLEIVAQDDSDIVARVDIAAKAGSDIGALIDIVAQVDSGIEVPADFAAQAGSGIAVLAGSGTVACSAGVVRIVAQNNAERVPTKNGVAIRHRDGRAAREASLSADQAGVQPRQQKPSRAFFPHWIASSQIPLSRLTAEKFEQLFPVIAV